MTTSERIYYADPLLLNGGHLRFFLFEGVLRRPVPLRVREIASLAGLLLLFSDGGGLQERREAPLERDPGPAQGAR